MNEDFYKQCADILGVPYDGEGFKYYRRTRWNNRKPGHGRYPGFGMIRRFGDSMIHVCLASPVAHNQVYTSEEDVFQYLRSIAAY